MSGSAFKPSSICRRWPRSDAEDPRANLALRTRATAAVRRGAMFASPGADARAAAVSPVRSGPVKVHCEQHASDPQSRFLRCARQRGPCAAWSTRGSCREERWCARPLREAQARVRARAPRPRATPAVLCSTDAGTLGGSGCDTPPRNGTRGRVRCSWRVAPRESALRCPLCARALPPAPESRLAVALTACERLWPASHGQLGAKEHVCGGCAGVQRQLGGAGVVCLRNGQRTHTQGDWDNSSAHSDKLRAPCCVMHTIVPARGGCSPGPSRRPCLRAGAPSTSGPSLELAALTVAVALAAQPAHADVDSAVDRTIGAVKACSTLTLAKCTVHACARGACVSTEEVCRRSYARSEHPP